jgi:hypothetical protein
LHVDLPQENRISHYTKEKITDELILNSHSSFRLYSVIYGNDDNESIKMLKYLGIGNSKDYFQQEKYRAFIGCFTFDNNILNQFRLYGKKDAKEATGVSIMMHNNFFSNDIRSSTEVLDLDNSMNSNKLPLFRCVYISETNNRIISIAQRKSSSFDSEEEYNEYKLNIDSIFIQVKKEMEQLKTDIEYSGLDKDVICKLLLNLRYLVKSTAYEEEQECRIMRIEKLNNQKVVHRENKEDGEKFFVRYLNMQNFINEVCFASNENVQSFIDSLQNRELSNIKVQKYIHSHKLSS